MAFRQIGYLCVVLTLSVSQALAATRLPIEFHHDQPFVEAVINQQPVKLIFDIGTPTGAMLSPELLLKFNAKDTGLRPNVHSYKSHKITRVFELEEMSLGGRVFHDISVIQYPGVELFTDSKGHAFSDVIHNGTLGLNKLLGLTVLLDYANKQIYLLDKDEPLPKEYKKLEWVTIPMQELGNHKVVTEAKVAGEDTWVLWDTGNNKMLIAPFLAKQLVKNIKPGKVMRIKDFYLGGINFGPQSFRVINGEIAYATIALGTPFFKKHVIQFQLDTDHPRVLIAK